MDGEGEAVSRGKRGGGGGYWTHKLIGVSKTEKQNKNKNPVSVTSFIISFLPIKW